MPLKNILKAAGCLEHFIALVFVILLIFAHNIPVAAAAGDLDPTFSGGGALRLTNPHQLYKPVVQPDGKILSLGSVRTGSFDNPVYISYLVRFLANGSYDNGFGAGGFLRPQIGQSFATGFSFALLPDGKIIVAGIVRANSTSPPVIGIFRYQSNGQPDLTFGSEGVATIPAGSVLGTSAVLIQPDGKILVCGAAGTTTSSWNFALLRFNPNGTPDASFGNNGLVIPDPDYNLQQLPYSMLLQADNKILVSGTRPGSYGFISVRFQPNGALDTSFGTNGKILLLQGTFNVLYDAALQSDGKIILIGTVFDTPAPYTMMLVRYTPDGQPDTSFGTGGKVLIALNNRDSQALGILIQPNGKILICGYNSIPNYRSAAMVARFNPSGTLDTSFGRGNGFVLTDYGNNGSLYQDIAMQPDGKIVAVGSTTLDKYSTNSTIARYLINDAPDFDFDGDGKADISIFRPSAEAEWYWLSSSTNQSSGVQFGSSADKPAPADFDGDGKTDVSVFRPSDGGWYRLNSSNNTFTGLQFGALGDLPVPGDFDGDTKADISVYRPSDGSWYRINSSTNQFVAAQFGIAEDTPLMGDFDGDGKSDLAVYRPSNGYWYRINSDSNTFSANQFGISEDKPVAADYDGDSKTDLAVYRPSVGDWYIINSSNSSFTGIHFGVTEDKPAPADFDGDGKADLVVFRPSSGTWYLLRTTSGFTDFQFGASGDVPTPNAFVR